MDTPNDVQEAQHLGARERRPQVRLARHVREPSMDLRRVTPRVETENLRATRARADHAEQETDGGRLPRLRRMRQTGGVAIKISRMLSRYAAVVTPPESGDEPWQSSEMVTGAWLADQLRTLGCSEHDIALAFLHADPRWLTRDRMARRRALYEQGHVILVETLRAGRLPTESEADRLRTISAETSRIREELDTKLH